MKKQIVIIGLGRFGISVAMSLAEQGHQVLGIDIDEKKVEEISDSITQAVTVSKVNEETLISLGIKEFDIAIVAIGDVESSILISQILKEIGVKKVISKAQSFLHGRVLEKIGVDKVAFPERDMGIRLANSLVSNNIIDYIELSQDYNVFEIEAPEDFYNKNLAELDIRARCNISIIAIKKKDQKDIIVAPGADAKIEKNDILVVIGKNSDLNKLTE